MKDKRQNDHIKRNFKLVWTATMVFIYLSVAYLLIFTPIFQKSAIPSGIRIALGTIFALYGIMRGYRLWKEK